MPLLPADAAPYCRWRPGAQVVLGKVVPLPLAGQVMIPARPAKQQRVVATGAGASSRCWSQVFSHRSRLSSPVPLYRNLPRNGTCSSAMISFSTSARSASGPLNSRDSGAASARDDLFD